MDTINNNLEGYVCLALLPPLGLIVGLVCYYLATKDHKRKRR